MASNNARDVDMIDVFMFGASGGTMIIRNTASMLISYGALAMRLDEDGSLLLLVPDAETDTYIWTDVEELNIPDLKPTTHLHPVN